MTAVAICLIAFIACYIAGKRGLGIGLLALLAFGYFYGILRANLLTAASHFIFDCGLLGLYCSQRWGKEERNTEALWLWTLGLIGWCVLIVFLPFQPLLVSLVGLRGNAFFLPILVLGARLKNKDLMQLAGGLAALNVVALGFACLEYFSGIQRFYPVSPVTEIIYISGDVAGGYYRIPAIFSSAHAYGGTMVSTLPYLVAGWSFARRKATQLLLLGGACAGLMGILFSATRVNFLMGSVILLVAVSVKHRSRKSKIVLILLGCVIAAVALSNARFQRFKSLGDTEGVTERIAGSVNRGFFEILEEYPMGNGLGGGGTSLPYFLAGQVRNPIGMENEYARILCEQGVIGLLLWIGFILWFISRGPVAFRPTKWVTSRKIIWCLAAFTLATMWAGVGFLTAIPNTVVTLLGMGWVSTPPAEEKVPRPKIQPVLRNEGRLATVSMIR